MKVTNIDTEINLEISDELAIVSYCKLLRVIASIMKQARRAWHGIEMMRTISCFQVHVYPLNCSIRIDIEHTLLFLNILVKKEKYYKRSIENPLKIHETTLKLVRYVNNGRFEIKVLYLIFEMKYISMSNRMQKIL